MLLQVDNTTSKCALMINYIIQYTQYEMPWIQLTSHALHKKSELTYYFAVWGSWQWQRDSVFHTQGGSEHMNL